MKIFLACLSSLVFTSIVAQNKNDSLYKEKYRPQFHFSPPKNWTNDPNGLVYHNGEYHLFFQYNPFGNEWGHMSWGHASSTDLIHWKNLPVAIPEQKNFMIFSGSAVSDIHNSSGLAKNKEIPIVAMYTAHTDSNQSQHLAYSLDNGKLWQQYAQNPVIDLHKKDFRDPSISWYAPGNCWLLAVSQPVEKMVSFYSSNNLKEWKWLSNFGPAGDTTGVWECPDLMQVPIANEEGKKKWVLFTSQNTAMQYFVGEFDGTKFINETPVDKIFRPDYGPDYYAAIVYHEVPESKNPVAIGWVNNWKYANDIPTNPWKGAMSLPRKLSVKKINNEWILLQEPLSSVQSLRLSPWQTKNVVVNKEEILPLESTQCEIDISWKPSPNSVSGVRLAAGKEKPFIIGYDSKKNKLFIDRSDAGEKSFNVNYALLSRYATKLLLQDDMLHLHIFFDNSIVEVFANDGEAVLTAQIFPDPSDNKISLFSNGSTNTFNDLQIWRIKSAW
jgi:fructan beta-fructosidase